MPRLAIAFMLTALAGCALFGGDRPAAADGVQGWRFASGRAPSRAEYAAVVAACHDGAVRRAQGQSLDSCLVELGLKHAE